MIWYEVRAEVPADLAASYEAYLREEHIPDLMETGCFVEASFCRAEADEADEADEAADAGAGLRVHFRSAYLAPDRGAMERYFAKHAGRLREHALRRFPDGLRFAREEWEVRERWGVGEARMGGPRTDRRHEH